MFSKYIKMQSFCTGRQLIPGLALVPAYLDAMSRASKMNDNRNLIP